MEHNNPVESRSIKFRNDLDFALEMDKNDPLAAYRDMFHFPGPGKDKVVYFCGNSLGLQPKTVKEYVTRELEDWQILAVDGHAKARKPWVSYEKFFQEPLAKITGARNTEVVAMNSLTANMHLLLASFYNPTKKRYKFIIDGDTFPSDKYAVESQIKWHGFDPENAIIEVKPDEKTGYIGTEAILDAIKEHGSSVAVVWISAVHYYNGELFDINKITKAAHYHGAYAGYDLAHAAGNVPLNLNENGVDFAVWCSYKYLNSGPGGVGGAFIHEKHHFADLPRLAGWWGHDPQTRFMMPPDFKPQNNILGWQLSNAPILSMAAHLAALEIFVQAGGIEPLREKSLLLTGYLRWIIEKTFHRHGTNARIITPEEPEAHGAQLSIEVKNDGKKLFNELTARNVMADWREPFVIRIAPAPLYNSFEDAFRFGKALEESIQNM